MAVSKLETKIKNNEFVITAEIFPPKGVDLSVMFSKVDIIKPYVDAVNVTDCQRAVMRISSLAVSKLLIDKGVEPVYQLTCRDRNRLALQSDILGAYALGVRNILIISGDYPTAGDHPDAKPVYDLDTIQLIKTIKDMEQGADIAGKALKGSPSFFLGAAINPSSTPSELAVLTLEKKIKAGAQFFQSQPIFHIQTYLDFKKSVLFLDSKIIVGVFLLKSYKFAEYISQIPGITIPEDILKRLKSSKDELKEGIKIAGELVKELKKHAPGVHIMAIGTEQYIPDILSV
ncbi:MAG: methylenetetrahydrofolate reductase [Elusimicrobiota bacterium]